MVTSLYRKVLPLSVRQPIYDFLLGRVVFFFRNFTIIAKSKVAWLFGFLMSQTEENVALVFIGRHGLTSYPYAFEYKEQIAVEQDVEKNLLYVIHNGKRLYFPEFYKTEKVQKDYRALLIDQVVRQRTVMCVHTMN